MKPGSAFVCLHIKYCTTKCWRLLPISSNERAKKRIQDFETRFLKHGDGMRLLDRQGNKYIFKSKYKNTGYMT
jgi:hypothetical protein